MTSERAMEAEMRAAEVSEVASGEPRNVDLANQTRVRFLDEKAEFYAGPEKFGEKNNPWVLVRDGLLRTIDLERDVREELFFIRKKAAKEAGKEHVSDEAHGNHPDQWFSFNTFVHTYSLIREKHKELIEEGKEGDENKDKPKDVLIPVIDRDLAHKVLREYVEGRKLLLAGVNLDKIKSKDELEKIIGGIDLHSKEDESLFRFPPSEYDADIDEVREVRTALKKQALAQTADEADQDKNGWASITDFMHNYNELEEASSFSGHPVMYVGETSMEALLKELIDVGLWESMYVENPQKDEDDVYYRRLPLEESEE